MTPINEILRTKAVNIKGKDYSPVKDRILALGELFEEGYSISTTYDYYPERKLWVVKAILNIKGQSFSGLAQEVESDTSSSVNHTSALENAETSAVGRACAMAGIGVLDSIASVDEVRKAENRTVVPPSEAHHIVPEITYSHINKVGEGTCKKCGLISGVQKLQKVTRYGASHVLNCECGVKTWLKPGQVQTAL